MPDESCPRCGKPVRSMARFCHGCGATIKNPRAPESQSPKPSQPSSSKIFMSPGGPLLEPPPAPDSSFPPKVKPKEEKPIGANPTETLARPDTATRNLPPSRDTGAHERPPEPPRRLERTGTQPISEYSDRAVNRSTVPLDKSVAIPGMKETTGSTKPLTWVDTPTATTAAAKPDHLSQTPAAPPVPSTRSTTQSSSGRLNRGPAISEQPIPMIERTARPQTIRSETPTQRIEPATLDSVMPHQVHDQASGRLYTQADFGSRLGAFVLDFLVMLIFVDVAMYLLSAFGGRQSLNWSLVAITLISALVLLINLILIPSFSGQTIGKRLLGIRIVHEDGGPLTFTGTIKRHFIGYLLSALPLMYGFISAMWAPRGQAWHDKIAKTVVVKNS